MPLIGYRHPILAQLISLWRGTQVGGGTPAASRFAANQLSNELAAATVMLAGEAQLRITASGAAVDALYGEHLAGTPAARLTPERDDAEREARTAIDTQRPLLIEDELRSAGVRRRVARLYLPLSNDDGSPDGVLCGVVAVV